MADKACKLFSGHLMLLSPKSQRKLIESCVSKDCIPADWTCESYDIMKNIQSLLDKFGTKFPCIESAKEFLVNLDWITGFPGSHQYYGLDAVEHFRPSMILYNGDEDRYHYKKDIYQKLGALIVKGTLRRESEQFGFSLISAFINTKESELPISNELYHISWFLVNELIKGMTVIGKMFETNGWRSLVPQEIDFSNHDAALKSYHRLVVNEEGEEVVRLQISERLKKFSGDFPFETNIFEYQKIYVWVSLILKLFKKFVKDNPLIALPRSETVNTIHREKVPVRMLSIFSSQYVIAHELLHTLKTEKLDVSGFENKILAMPKYTAVDRAFARGIIPAEIFERIDFVSVEVMLSVFGSTLIPTFNGEYCALGSEFLVSTLSDLIETKKVFYGMKTDQRGVIDDLFDEIERVLGNDCFLVNVKDVDVFNTKLQSWHKTYFPSRSKLEIRKARRFTLKDLKKELKHLELLEIFPDILGHAKQAYIVKAFKSGWDFNMHDLVQKCLLMSLARQFPKFSRFLHKNKLCNVTGGCPYCDKTLNLDEPPVKEEDKIEPEKVLDAPSLLDTSIGNSLCEDPISDEDLNLEKRNVEPSDPSISQDTLLEGGKELSESAVPVEEENENATTVKPKKKRPVQRKRKLDVRESQSCPKCFRASQFTRALTEKVRLGKVEKKALKKQVKELDATVGEFEIEKEEWKKCKLEMLAKIEMLEQKLGAATLEQSEIIEIVKTEAEEQQPEIEAEAPTETISDEEKEKENVLSEPEIKEQRLVVEEVAIPQIKREEQIKKAEVLSKFEQIKMTIQMENPLEKVEELTNEACNSTNYKRAKQFLKQEKELFSKSCQSYIETLRSNMKMIHKDEFDLTTLPEFPSLSKKFVDVYKRVMQCKPPVICESLLKKQDDGLEANAYAVPVENPGTDLKDCLICFEDLTPEDDLLQCWKCKRHCHKEELMEWFKVKRTCPLCSAVILDEDEYPALS